LLSYQHLCNCFRGINISQPTSREGLHLPTAYLILQLLMQNRQTCPQYLGLCQHVLICQTTLAKSMLSKHLINNFMRYRQLQKHIMDLFEVVKCSTQVHTVHYMHNFKGITYKCEFPDSPALLNCFPINICATVLEASTSVNQQVAKASICPQLT
jgi:hypothetical protein